MTDWVHPEDHGTGAYPAGTGDPNDAADFASAYHVLSYGQSFVASGLGFTYDAGGPTLDVASGKALITDSTATATQSGSSRVGVAYIIEADPRLGIALTDSATNHVYLVLDLSSPDSFSVVTNTTGSTPVTGPALKIGTVDTGTDTVTELNRKPLDGVEGLLADPQTPASHGNEAHDENYVASSEVGTMYVSDTTPSSPSTNDVWFDTS
jgi:hypothetical protein